MWSFLKWSGAALIAALAVLVGVNLFDESLYPGAAAYGEPRSPAVPDAENGYLALVAMSASDGADAMAYARAWLEEVRAAARAGRRAKPPAREQARRPALCDPQERSCLAFVRKDAEAVARELEPFAEDLSRYERMLAFTRFEEVLDFPIGVDTELPSYGPALRAHRAWLLRIAVDLEAGRIEQAVAALEREVAWQRLFLGQSRLLLSKMVAAAALWRDLMFLSHVLSRDPAELAPFLPRLRAMVAPLDAAVRSLPQVAETEFALVRASLAHPPGRGEGAGTKADRGLIDVPLLYQPNATVNLVYRYYSMVGKAVLGAPADKVTDEWKAFARVWSDPPWWRYLYNPAGLVLFSVGNPAWDEYPLRLHDLDALNRLVALRLELLAAGTGREETARFVAASERRLHDPYTLKPMRWDPAAGRLYFEARSKYVKDLREGVENGRVFLGL